MDRLSVLGLDLSPTSTGGCHVAGGPGGGDPWPFLIRSARRGYPRMESMTGRIALAVERCQPDLIVIEGPAYHAKGAYFHENAGLWWLVTYRIWEQKIPLAVIPPTTVKKWGTGSGNASKSAMCVAAATRFHLAQVSPDEADALWLAAAGCQHYGFPLLPMPAVNVAALEATGRTGHPVIGWPDVPLAADGPRAVTEGVAG